MASFTCPPGAICPPSAGEPIGANKTQIYYSTATTVTQGSDGKVNGAERVLYIEKNGSYQPAAISKDGGKTYNFSDPKYPLMAGVAGADLQNDLNNPASGMHKNVDAGIAKYLPKTGIPPTQQKAVVAATANQATNPGTADGSTVAAGPAESGKAAGGTKTGANSFGDFVYPEGIRSSKQDVIKFTMLEYKPSGTGATQSAGQSDRKTKNGIPVDRTILGSVVLPIPNNISDTNSMDWGSDSMNALKAALAAAAFTGITEGIGKGISSFGDSMKAFLGDDTSGKALGATFAAGAVSGDGAKLLSRAEGAVINPNLELLFNGPQLRPFNFTFKLAAREKRESEQIIKILNFFKRGSSAIKTESNLFLKAPHTFSIQYLHMGQGGKDHQFIGRIKECALQSITTNYTPEGQYATFNDGVMVSYQITMQFSELEPIFNSDYDNIEGIGY
jgi:hypothetical protein